MNTPDQAASPRFNGGHGFGTGPVFLASVSTILGAIMFLRFGYAVGHTGLLGALGIILLGHMVTVPTALAIAEIATNRRVEGGGEYFIISRSFGTTIGGAIGVSLYLSQAISVAFYMIAFGEAFSPLAPWLQESFGLVFDVRWVSIPATLALTILILSRGADLGVKALWVVAGVLGLSLAFFFLGTGTEVQQVPLFAGIEDADPFILVFAICFPAFTGMTAGVGLSGDLANPRKSIPLGIMSATLAGMVVYVALVLKLSTSATPETLADTSRLVMADIAVWGPIIPIGLACASLSSALGSILVAPRTLQAIGADGIIPTSRANAFVAEGIGATNEPRNATLITSAAALAFVTLGSVDLVAQVISMFFMVTYGALCAISFLEHFAARPSYRPSFRSKWWISLTGALMCLLIMFQMNPLYALASIAFMTGLYALIRYSRKDSSNDLAAIFSGVMTQATRVLQIKLQKTPPEDWRPSIIMVTPRTFDRSAPVQFLAWLCHRYGFGTYLHFVEGKLDRATFERTREMQKRMVQDIEEKKSAIYVDTMISPSFTSALAQSLQAPGVSGMENNSVLFEFSIHDPFSTVEQVVTGCRMAAVPRMNRLVLRHGDHYFGNRSHIHLWLTWHDYRNANLMIILAYVLLGHPDWRRAEIKIFAAFPYSQVGAESAKLVAMIQDGRLPITYKNVEVIPTDDDVDFGKLVAVRSEEADLVVLGFTEARLNEKGGELFQRHPQLKDVLFVSSEEEIYIE
ncbi:MAG: amino acid permease [Gemmatimonadota bacterium]|nr:amino acid permease [Gemmatimonadota bacterium]